MVAGTGGGDIEEAQSLEVVGVEQGVGVGPMRGVHQLLGERHGDAALLGEVDDHPAGHSLAAKVGEDANRELEALGAVRREDAHGVVIGFRRNDLVDPDVVVRMELAPGEERTEVATTRLTEGTCGVEERADPPPGVSGPW